MWNVLDGRKDVLQCQKDIPFQSPAITAHQQGCAMLTVNAYIGLSKAVKVHCWGRAPRIQMGLKIGCADSRGKAVLVCSCGGVLEGTRAER